ncbi:MAG: Alginate lyase domain-containing protein [Bacteroidetes bacterium]|nr:Alginate lyase domain-containing protein [Bacteroidota bacterium]
MNLTRKLLLFTVVSFISHPAITVGQLSHPRLMADRTEIEKAKSFLKNYAWYRNVVEAHKRDVDRFIQKRPIFVSPVKQTYQYKMYSCPKHDVELLYEDSRPYQHRCPKDTTESYSGGKYDASWAGWYNRVLASRLVWMGVLYNLYDDARYADAGREILMQFAGLYLTYPTTNTILGPAHVFFGTLSESFWGVDMAYGYDLLYEYKGFSPQDHATLKEKLFYPLAKITQKFPESASNRQLWYNNVSAAVGFLYGDQELIDFALKGEFGFSWQLGAGLPESGFWAEWSGYHYVALRGMIHLAEMARHNGLDLYHDEIAGRSMKKMFDVPFDVILPNYEFPRNKDSGGGNILEYATYYEIGYAVYKDPKYLALLSLTNLVRGKQVVGETSALGEADAPITMFNIEPELPRSTTDIIPERSTNLEGNGFAALRNGTGKERRYLYLDYGIMGGEHGHPDRLQIGYYANGRNWIVDPLNESYFDPMLQLWFRQTIAHNTIVINQTTQTWTNGYGIFYGDLPGLQVASGGTETAYAGTKLTRTLVQVGDYFIDVFDVVAPEKRIIDWPMHSFGSLKLEGLNLTPEPIDRFGHKPGIPGYDQLTEISSAFTDSSWSGVYTDEGHHLLVKAIGEKNTQVFQSISPRIGGFYKQMVKDPRPLPMVFSRREAASTRFVHLMQAYVSEPTVTGFESSTGQNSYVVHRRDGKDIVRLDIQRSQYSVLRNQNGKPVFAAGFNLKDLKDGSRILINSDYLLSKFECHWDGQKLSVVLPDQFNSVTIWAPEISSAEVNGKQVPFERQSDRIIIRRQNDVSIELLNPVDSTLYVGQTNRLRFRIWNPTDSTIEAGVKLKLVENWNERVNSQLTWWGGIVNLRSFHKGSVQRRTFPLKDNINGDWIDGKASATKRIKAKSSESFEIDLHVPNDAPPVTYDVVMSLGSQRIHKSFRAALPVSVDLMMPNGEREILLATLENNTHETQNVSLNLTPHAGWTVSGPLQRSMVLPANAIRRVTIPIRRTGYHSDNQLYPIRARVESGQFRYEVERDFYSAIAHFTKLQPALDGTWRGWNKNNPVTIDDPNQICRLLMGNQPWNGLADLSAQVYVMYDNNYLYVGADVKDDSLITHWDFPRMSYPWDSDCMEVILDTRTTSDQGADPPSPGLYRQLSMAEYRVTDFGANVWKGGGAGGPLLPKPNLAPGAETFYRRTTGGYAVISRFPLSTLNITAKPGYKLGFDVSINDNDGLNYRKNQHIWAGFNQNQSWWDVGTIGVLIFGPK